MTAGGGSAPNRAPAMSASSGPALRRPGRRSCSSGFLDWRWSCWRRAAGQGGAPAAKRGRTTLAGGGRLPPLSAEEAPGRGQILDRRRHRILRDIAGRPAPRRVPVPGTTAPCGRDRRGAGKSLRTRHPARLWPRWCQLRGAVSAAGCCLASPMSFQRSLVVIGEPGSPSSAR
jgi:hypothetical protein